MSWAFFFQIIVLMFVATFLSLCVASVMKSDKQRSELYYSSKEGSDRE